MPTILWSSKLPEKGRHPLDPLPTFTPNADAPLYRQLKAWLSHRMRTRAWPPGARLPSERQLSEDLRLSRATVRRAVEELVREEWLVKRHGRGTFVTAPKLEQRLGRVRGFSENMRALGVSATSHVLHAELVAATDDVAARLELPLGSAVAEIARVRLADGEAVMVEVSRLNCDLTVGILAHDLTGSLYDLLEREYRIRLRFGHETLEVRGADSWVAGALDTGTDAALLYTERVTRDEHGVAVEFTQRFARADRCRFRVEMGTGRADFTLRDPE